MAAGLAAAAAAVDSGAAPRSSTGGSRPGLSAGRQSSSPTANAASRSCREYARKAMYVRVPVTP